MSLNDPITHHGLLSAIGPCSDETKAVLTTALSYFGISSVSSERSPLISSIFELPFRDRTTISGTDLIEFDDETRSWRRTQRVQTTCNSTNVPSQKKRTPPDLLAYPQDDNDARSLPKRAVHEDWTTLLPATDHVNFLKSRKWHQTSLGPMLEWPYALRLMTMKMLADPRPANLYWGPTQIAIYNEPFSTIAASRHPMMMGSTAKEAMPATYPFLSQVFAEIDRTGVAFSMPEFEMSVEKVAGFVEEAWYDGIFSPIRDTDGSLLGLYNSGYEVTDRKVTQRNAEIVHQIAAGPASQEISQWQHVIDVCSRFDRDIPFLVLYSADEQEAIQSTGLTVRYQGSLGIEKGHPALPENLNLHHDHEGFRPVLRAARAKQSSVALDMPGGKLPKFLQNDVDWRGHGDACTHIIASPLYTNGLLAGFSIMGLNPRRRYDEAHKQLIEDVRRAVNSILTHSISANQAEKREEKLTKELTRRQNFLQGIAEIATVGIYTYSSDGLLTWANPIYFDITGITPNPEDRYNYEGIDYIMNEDKEKGTEGFQRCLETKSLCTLELRLNKTWRPSGSEFDEPCWVMTTITPNVENGKVVDVLGFITDISHLKWAEKVQMEAAESAKRAKEQQERFIDITSHEMRNPLSAILQCADDITTVASTLEHSPRWHADGHCNNAFQTILENARSISFCAAHQNRIVDDILTVSKLDSSMSTVTPVVINLQTVVTQTIRAFAAKMAAEDIQSRLEIQQGYVDLCIASIYSDPSRITQILINLITNAIKFTKKAQRKDMCVRINALKKRPLLNDPTNRVQWFPSSVLLAKLKQSPAPDVSDDVVYIMFEVEDSGTGISKEEMKHLFNRFAQATPKTHITYGGSGLGLFISRELVELQGGMIGISSQPGSGSIFAFYIETRKTKSAESTDTEIQPIWYEGLNLAGTEKKHHRSSEHNESDSNEQAQSPPLLDAPPQSTSSKSWSILLVEDNLINQKVLSKQLERLGCIVFVANHGIEALDQIKKSKHWISSQVTDPRIDVILMDWEMPIMDGLTCTKQIREMEAIGSIAEHLPIIGVTANARPEQVELARSAGMDDVVTKPFTVTALTKRIESLLR